MAARLPQPAAEAVDADVHVGLAGTERRRGELRTVGAVGKTLRFEGQRLAEAERTTVFADRRTVEEVAAVELQSRLVTPHLQRAARRRLINACR